MEPVFVSAISKKSQVYVGLICLTVFLMLSPIFCTFAQDHITLKIEGIEAIDHDWVEKINPLALDKGPIEKYYSQKKGRHPFHIGKLTISPTGDRIAFSVNDSSVWVVRGNGTGLLCLTQELEKAHSPFWLKDGKTITFIQGGDERNYGQGTLMQVTPEGTHTNKIENQIYPWMYSPDKKYLLEFDTTPSVNNLYIVSTRDKKVLSTYKANGSLLDELWFPNGEETLIEEFLGHGDSKLVTLSLNGKHKIILPKGRMDMRPVIHPSGQIIAYFYENEKIASDKIFHNVLHLLTKDGGKDHQIIRGNSKFYINNMAWFPQGDFLIFSCRDQIFFLKFKKTSALMLEKTRH